MSKCKYTNTQKHNYTKHQHKLPNMQWNYCCIQTSFCYIYSVKCFNFPCILSGKTVWFFLEHLQTHILTVPRMIRIARELNIHCQGLDFWNKLFVAANECKSAERRLQLSWEISERKPELDTLPWRIWLGTLSQKLQPTWMAHKDSITKDGQSDQRELLSKDIKFLTFLSPVLFESSAGKK